MSLEVIREADDRSGPKRISYLQRRADIDQATFRSHWSQIHSQIAKDLPRVRAYVQNHIVARHSIGAEAAGAEVNSRIDGMVELWFKEEAAAEAGFTSDVADRLAVDELNFLQGLGGCAVHGGCLDTADSSAVVWVVADWMDESFPKLWRELADSVDVPPHRIAMNRVSRGAKRLIRPPLRVMPIADVAVSIGVDSLADAQAVAAQVAASTLSWNRLRNPRLLVGERLRFI